MAGTVRWEANPIIVKGVALSHARRPRFCHFNRRADLAGNLWLRHLSHCPGCNELYQLPLSPQVGQMLFAGLVFIELMIISAITPSVTAMAISGEKEKQTYEMLLGNAAFTGQHPVGQAGSLPWVTSFCCFSPLSHSPAWSLSLGVSACVRW